jgi:hypothetical protein
MLINNKKIKRYGIILRIALSKNGRYPVVGVLCRYIPSRPHFYFFLRTERPMDERY